MQALAILELDFLFCLRNMEKKREWEKKNVLFYVIGIGINIACMLKVVKMTSRKTCKNIFFPYSIPVACDWWIFFFSELCVCRLKRDVQRQSCFVVKYHPRRKWVT